MQLFCINCEGWEEDRKPLFGFIKRKPKDCDGPIYGDIVTIDSSYYDKGRLYHNLIEWPDSNPDHGFEAQWFIPLSSIDETEMERNYKTERV